MFEVSIESDAAYREVETDGAYLEICPKCGLDRREEDSRCTCGQEFSKKEFGFFKAGWEPPKLAVAFPQMCPKTLGSVSRTRAFYTRRVTGVHGSGPAVTPLRYEVPVGQKLHSPLVWGVGGVRP